LLVRSDLKYFSSSRRIFDPFIRISHFYKLFFSRVEVNLDNFGFSLVYFHFYFGNLFVRIK
jgi:hypothetical protein